MTTLVSAGDLRTELLELLDGEHPLEVLCAAPGLLSQGFDGLDVIARRPDARMSTRLLSSYRSAMLHEFASSVDRLPQDIDWELRLARWIEALSDARARVWLARRKTAFTRLISRPGRTLVSAGPVGLELDEPRLELTGQAHASVRRWCRERIDGAQEITPEVLKVLQESWAGPPLSPEDLYLKVLYEYFSSTLGGLDRETDDNPMLEWLTEFQVEAYHFAKGILRRYGGVFLADVVGLGKTFIAMALLRHLGDRYGHHAVVVAPPAVLPAWEELAHEHRVELVPVSIGKLDDLDRHMEREILVIDESHNFRNRGTRRYDTIQAWLRPNGDPSAKQILLLSATPQNNDTRDVLNQLRFFPDNYARLPFRGETLDEWFREVRHEPGELAQLLQHVVVRRTRTFVKAAFPEATVRWQGPRGEVEEKPLVFPERISGADQCLRYTLDQREDGSQIYDQTIRILENMHYPLHGLGLYVADEYEDSPEVENLRRAGRGLRGLYKVLLLKRLESSLYSFSKSTERLMGRLEGALEDLKDGKVAIRLEESADAEDEAAWANGSRVLPARFFKRRLLLAHLQEDRRAVQQIRDSIDLVSLEKDPKLVRLEEWLIERLPCEHKTIIFTQFSDTAAFLRDSLGQEYGNTAMVTGSTSGRTRLAHRFSPKSNRTSLDDGREIELLISTDALSEGVNLQDADTLINYDLHWNPVRLIQRAGRIDRIGSENESIVIASFLPERGLERNLGMEQVLRRRIDEFLQVFGEDSRILPSEDKPDVDEMMSAYSGQALEDADASEELDGLSRHVNRILAIRRDEPERFGQIAALRLGRRSVSASERAPVVAARVGWYWTFWKGHGLGAVLPMEDLAGLDLLFQHAESGPAQSPAHAPGPLVESARNAFEEEANTFLAQRAQPKLSAAEDWILRKLNDYRSVCVATQRDLVDDLSRWVEAGQAKALVQRQGRRWKRQKLSATAVFHEIKSLYARYPGGREVLGEPEIVGIVVGSEKGA